MSEAEDQTPIPEETESKRQLSSITMSPITKQKTGTKSLKLNFSEMNSSTVSNTTSTEVIKNKTSNLTQVYKNETKVQNKTTYKNETEKE